MAESAAAWCGQFGAVTTAPEMPMCSVESVELPEGTTQGDLARTTGAELVKFNTWLQSQFTEYPELLPDSDPHAHGARSMAGMIGQLSGGLKLWAG